MDNSNASIPIPVNEPIKNYLPNSSERESIKNKLNELQSEQFEIPAIIGGKEVFTGKTKNCVMPHDHSHVLGKYHLCSEKEVVLAINAATKAKSDWESMPWESRISIFKRMASLLSGPYRDLINGATMLGQSKNIFQAEIDAACELIDFFNFNSYFLQKIYGEQPLYSPEHTWNSLEYRALEGFVFAVTPFNFTSIAANLPAAPALMGNTALWKPASSSVYSNYFIMNLFKEAGLPDGVINFIPGAGKDVGNVVLNSPDLAGIHFTGSTPVFQSMWKHIGTNIGSYKSYPRIVGETGGKDFIIAHESADPEALITAMIRGAFEFQGQKCSAASRAYIPSSIWKKIKTRYVDLVNSIKIGHVQNFKNFMNAVIDENAFNQITSYINEASNSSECEIITGGTFDSSKGYFIDPTTIVTSNPKYKTMVEEIFGPVLTIYIYDDSFEEICNLADQTSPYALTGAVISQDRSAIIKSSNILKHSAGNFYINDKPTGAVVGQQPFGGSRASGTNDKAGSTLNLLRWTSQRTIKENFLPPQKFEYPFMDEE